MAQQTVIGGLWIPGDLPTGVVTLPGATIVLNTAGYKAAFILRVPKTGNVARIGFRTASVTTATDTDLRLETVDAATGDPTGTLYGTNTNVTIASASITSNTWIWGTLTAAASVTKDDYMAIVIAPTGTPNYQVSRDITGITAPLSRFPYADYFTAAWAKQTNPGLTFGIEYASSDRQFVVGMWPGASTSSHISIANGANPDRAGLKFQLPVPARFGGFAAAVDMDGDVQFILYGPTDNVLYTSPTFDKDIRGTGTSGGVGYRLPSADEVNLSANTVYRLVAVATTVTAATVGTFTVAAAAEWDFYSGGQNFYYTQSPSPVSFTDTTTRRPVFAILLNGFDDGVGGSGAAIHPVYG